MKKLLITSVLLLLLVFITSSIGAIDKNASGVIQEESFLQKFIEALKANDQIRMEELVRQTKPHVVFDAVISLARMGITSVAEGKGGSMYFHIAYTIAAFYAEEYKKKGLSDLVMSYKDYDQKMCTEKLKGDKLKDEGISYYRKGQWQEALDLWTTALKIFEKIGDVAGEALALNNIGLVYRRLGQYSEALDYYQQSLDISRKIGDVA